MMMSSKYKLFDRYGPLGRGPVSDLDICSPFCFMLHFFSFSLFFWSEVFGEFNGFGIFGLLL